MKKSTFFLLLCLAITGVSPISAHAQIIATIAGSGLGDGRMATDAELLNPAAVTTDDNGNIIIADGASHRVRMISAVTGMITTIAGSGMSTYTGDGGPATAAGLGSLFGIARDNAGNIYLADAAYNCIRKVSAAGIISTIAGGNTTGAYTGDGGPATAAKLNNPTDIVVDAAGNIMIADNGNHVVRQINTSGIITTIVGNGLTGKTGNGGPATASQLGTPYQLALDNKGNLFVAEVDTMLICKVDAAGIITIIAGTGAARIGTDGDGGPATAATMSYPTGIAADTSGNVYFSDDDNSRVRVINLSTGIINNFAFTGVPGSGGDGGPATAAQVNVPAGLHFDSKTGHLLICDEWNNKIRMVNTAGTIATVAGQNGLFDEGIAATTAEISVPNNIASDAAGNVYIADYYNNRIRKVNAASGAITTVAGNGVYLYSSTPATLGDGAPATNANLASPAAVTVDNAGNIYFIDESNERVRMVNTAGIITTIAGNGNIGYNGDNRPATSASLFFPIGIAVDNTGNVFIADQYNSRIRKVDPSGTITTVAGTGVPGYAGDGRDATTASVNYPADVATDGKGNLFIADLRNNCVRKVDISGIITTVAGNGSAGYSGDGGPATAASISQPNGLKADTSGNIYIVDGLDGRICVVNSAGIIHSVAGNGTIGNSGDGGPATAAQLNGPSGVGVDGSGNIYIADGNNYSIRKVTAPNVSVPVVKGSLGNISVYPNPAHTAINIMVNAIRPEGLTLTMSDVAGNVVYKTAMVSNKQVVDISSLDNGVYFIAVKNTGGEAKTISIIKQ